MADAPEMFNRSQRHRKQSHKGLIALLLAAAVIVAAIGVGWWLITRTEHPVKEGVQVEVRVPQGAGTEQIARTLSSYGVINNSIMFQIKARIAHAKMRPGTYLLATGMPDDLVFKRLALGPQITYYDIPIPPGFTAKQVARRFAARAGVDEDEMMKLVTSGASQFAVKHPYLAQAYDGSLEGYLWPATYRIKKGTKPAAIVEMMLKKYDAATAGLDLTYAKSKNLTPTDILIIASIIEREAKLSKDRPKVASVIYNRLHARMRLQLDSTVFYVAPEGRDRLTKDDLWIQSPYNTYRNAGLPPGPICNPGLDALEAAAHPEQTQYLYYVLTGKDGSQTFATNYQDFLKAVKKYHQVFGE
jgi:UPF0755 protein